MSLSDFRPDFHPLEQLQSFRVTSAHMAKVHIGQYFRSHEIEMEGGNLDGFRHVHCTVGRLSLNYLTYGVQTRIRTAPLRDFYMLQLTLRGRARYESEGRAKVAQAGDLLVINPDQGFTKTWGASCSQVIVRIDRELVDERVEDRGAGVPVPLLEPVCFEPGPHRPSPRTRSLYVFLNALCDDVATGASGWAAPILAGTAQRALVDLMLASLGSSHACSLNETAQTPLPHHLLRALDFVKVHARRTLRLGEIADAAGTRPRTLHKAFRHHIGLSPMSYLKQVRLELARRDLLEGAVQGRKVTEIALDCGFDHLSKFARDYRDRYGESPSDTLREAQRRISGNCAPAS